MTTHAPVNPDTGVCGKPGCAGGHRPGACTGHASAGTGRPCRNDPVRGATVCRMHGATAPQVRKAAQLRLLEAADDAAGVLIRLALDRDVPANVRRAAASDLLDRAGLSARHHVQVEHVDLGDERARLAELEAIGDELQELRARKASGA